MKETWRNRRTLLPPVKSKEKANILLVAEKKDFRQVICADAERHW